MPARYIARKTGAINILPIVILFGKFIMIPCLIIYCR